jgi:hypothetical protein
MGRARVFVQAPAIFDRNRRMVPGFLFIPKRCDAKVVVWSKRSTASHHRHHVLESHKNKIMAA